MSKLFPLGDLRARLRRRADFMIVSVHNLMERKVQEARLRQYQAHSRTAPSAVLLPEATIINVQGNPDNIHVGEGTAVRGELHTFGHGGNIRVGDYCYIGAGTRLWSAASIRVGDRVLISHRCEIHDWNAHPLESRARHQHFIDIMSTGHPKRLDDVGSAPIVIEDDAWVGFGSTILKGVTIGRASIVAACSLVKDNVPPGVLVAGNPARIVRELPAELVHVGYGE